MSTSTELLASHCTRLLIGLSLFAMSLITPPAVAGYAQHNLVTDDQANLTNLGYSPADHDDPNLVNPWGIARSATSPFWVSNNGWGVSSLYNGAGVPESLVVSVPGPGGNTGKPTGQVFNGGSNFQVSDGSSGPARFLFATEAGTIAGWNPGVPPPPTSTNAITALDNSASHAIYKGLAIDSPTTGSLIYAADFGNGKIDVFDGIFAPATLAGSFTDPNLPQGFAPFNIQDLGGELFVTYAFKANPGDTDETSGAGLGIVDVYNTQGQFLRRLINNGGMLNAPWGMAIAPFDFGQFSNDILVGNFGDGLIHAFDPLTGIFQGTLSDANSNPIVIDGLWGLMFGSGGTNGGRTDTLYFTAGIPTAGVRDSLETHGLLGSLSAVAVPEPATLPMIVLGLVLACSYTRRSVR